VGPIYDDFAHPERDDKRLPGDWKDAHPDAIPSSPGDLDGSADVSRRVSVDVMRKPERHSLTLTCGTDYDGFSTCSLVGAASPVSARFRTLRPNGPVPTRGT